MKSLAAAVTILVCGAGASSWLKAQAVTALAAPGARTLDIYFIDVEGGQSTLLVTPAGQSMLIDTGYAGNGQRDPDRIMAVARTAHVDRLDYLLITHFHGDHAGGAPEIARRLPITTFVDYGEPIETASATVEAFNAYKVVRERGKQLHPGPGDKLDLVGLEVEVASAAGVTLTKPLSRAGGVNTACGGPVPENSVPSENPRSLGVRITYGRFTFLDLGDLPGTKLAELACPVDLIGHADLYLVPHHGNQDTAIPAVVAAVSPKVAILNNGAEKGGHAPNFATLRGQPGIQDTWQLHRSRNRGVQNFPDELIANLDEGPKDTGAWIKVSADESGAFTVTNSRNGLTRSYR
jgi:beta-lactamase superfamily II metal-dependent hydrolase